MMASKRKKWLWVFAVLAVLAVLAMGINFVYSRGQQLQPQQLAEARQKWDANRPADYDLTVVRVVNDATSNRSIEDTFVVRVRGGQPVDGTINGQPLEARLLANYDIGGLFDAIEEFLDRDRRPGQPPVFVRAAFDKTDGHLRQFVRRVSGTRERQMIRVDLKRV